MLRRRQPEIGHQPAGIVEPVEVANFGHHRHRHDERDPAHGLYRPDYRREAQARQQDRDLIGQSLDPGLGVSHGMDIVLEHDLLRRVFEANRRQPVRVSLRPTLLAGTDPAVPQQEPL